MSACGYSSQISAGPTSFGDPRVDYFAVFEALPAAGARLSGWMAPRNCRFDRYAISRGSNTIGPTGMARRRIDFDTVRRLARELGDVEESTIHGAPSLKVRGKLLTCIPVHKSAEPGSLAVRIDFDHRSELIATAPDIYYLTDHYVNYPAVLVRLSRIEPDALKDLLGMAWSFVTMNRRGRR